MKRTTAKDLKRLLPRIRALTDTPEMLWTARPDGKGSRCPVGAYAIESGSRTYGYQWKLVQMCNESGGERTILSAPTADGLEELILAWLQGMDYGITIASKKAHMCDDRGML